VTDELTATARHVLRTWKEITTKAQASAQRMGASCTKGCTGCCYLLAVVSFADAVVLAVHLVDSGTWEEWVPRLRAQALTLTRDGRHLGSREYFAQKVPCAFLDTQTGLCAVYRHRPVPCRTHYVVTDPALCEPGTDQVVGKLDLYALEAIGLEVSEKLNPEALSFAGPLPLAVLFALGVVFRQRGRDDLVTKLEPLVADLPEPGLWVETRER
jgi:Fe-S-cluster containining protein